ncbi:hypothetical protein mRhiFer1_001863 [Rhinolophus ferrumequinum]|uniref:Sperm acrosome associated 7 n=1 Tax=Rhinolophus ferrumequinum TaxID=59479 RepID=A0A7J7R2K2_RHIFE|nr:uncharacterized protein C2orf92 homolog isoform X3 [Rhinolophus ferrumequinum]KAF6270391.1 hypothetical protein mRhiFer1_001863 [Rhinolophus ferrumequinum]
MVKLRGAGALLFVLFLDCWQCADMHQPFPPVEGSNADRSPSSKNLEEGMAKIFDEILLQVFSSITFDESRRTAGKSMTKRATEERSNADRSPSSKNLEEGMAKIFENNPTNDENHNPPHVENILQTLQRTVGHISEERKRKAPSLFNRAVSEPLTTVDQGRVKPDTLRQT